MGEIVLIDPDTVEAPNVATQETYLSDVGRPKSTPPPTGWRTSAPSWRWPPLQARFEELHPATFHQLLHRPLRSGASASRATPCCAPSPTTPESEPKSPESHCRKASCCSQPRCSPVAGTGLVIIGADGPAPYNRASRNRTRSARVRPPRGCYFRSLRGFVGTGMVEGP